jgi:hypothetical protein
MESNDTSLDAAVSAAYEKAHSAPTDSPPAAAPPESSPQEDAPASEAPPAAGPQRDEHGRFRAKEAAPAEGPAKPEAAPPVEPPQASDQGAAKAPAAKDPTAAWPVGDREMFKELPEAAQKFLLRRHREMESGFTQKTMALAGLKDFEPVAELFRPYESQLKVQGLKPADIIQRWAAAEQFLQQNPAEALSRIGRMYGIEIEVKGQGNATQPLNPQGSVGADANGSWLAGDPVLQQMQAKLAQLEHAKAEQERQHYSSQIDQFANMRTPEGKLAHPYFERVRQAMAGLIYSSPQGQAPDLEAIYQKAIWADPEVRDELLAAQRDAAARAAREKAAAAGKAGISLGSGAPLPGSDRPAPQSLDQTIREAWNRAHR